MTLDPSPSRIIASAAHILKAPQEKQMKIPRNVDETTHIF
jgi:hypothetical protein